MYHPHPHPLNTPLRGLRINVNISTSPEAFNVSTLRIILTRFPPPPQGCTNILQLVIAFKVLAISRSAEGKWIGQQEGLGLVII